jgi:hypothetical protein
MPSMFDLHAQALTISRIPNDGGATHAPTARHVGQVDHPVTTAEKVRAIVELARDEQVAVVAVDGLLRRPEVAFKVMADSVARHIVNQA